VVALAPQDPAIRWAALLHDIAKPATYSEAGGISHFYGHDEVGAMMAEGIMRRFRYSNQRTEIVTTLVREHMSIPQILCGGGRRATRRLLDRVVPHHEHLYDLTKADMGGHRSADEQRLQHLETFWEEARGILIEQENVFRLPSGLGALIMEELGIPEGPEIGEAIAQVKNGIMLECIPVEPSGAECIDYLCQHGKGD
jgi:putative nucleotidyltransferase with HDIG domain